MLNALEQSLMARGLSVQVLQAQKLLKAAVSKSHPPTARYIVEAAAACLDHGLQATAQGLVLKPVAWNLLTSAVKKSYPEVTNLLDRLHGSVGQKYFKLLGTTQSGQPELVSALLDSLIISSQRPAVSHLLGQLQAGSSKQPKQSTAAGQQPALPQNAPSFNLADMTVRAPTLIKSSKLASALHSAHLVTYCSAFLLIF